MVVQIVWFVSPGWVAHVFLHDAQDAPKQREYKLLTGLVGVHEDILPSIAMATDYDMCQMCS